MIVTTLVGALAVALLIGVLWLLFWWADSSASYRLTEALGWVVIAAVSVALFVAWCVGLVVRPWLAWVLA